MFNRIVNWLEDNAHGEISSFKARDLRIAVAALYYHLITEDGLVSPDELTSLRHILMDQFGLDSAEADQLTEKAIEENSDGGGLFSFTVILNRSLTTDQRKQVFESLCKLADADGHRHPLELQLLDHIQKMLKLD